MAQLSLVGRTITGYVADLSQAAISFQSNDPRIAAVDKHGQVHAARPGLARIVATVKWPDAIQTSYIEVYVASR